MTRITTIDAHTAGEPLRVILGGFPEVRGSDVLEYRRFVQSNYDHLRTALMWEPRGHADMYGCLVLPPITTDAHFSVLFLHNEGYSTMCGHGIIAVTKVALEAGLIEVADPLTTVRIDSPAGRITAYARTDHGDVSSVFFDNVPSFVDELDAAVDVPGLGAVRYDLAFGGAYYAYVDASALGLGLDAESARDLIDAGMAIKQAVMDARPIRHPFEKDLGFLYGTVFVGPAHHPANHSRNVCIFADGEVDRSPTGTGVSGRLAIHFARDEIGIGEQIVIESIIGSTFSCSVLEETSFGPHRAIIPRVEGRAFLTGKHEFIIDPSDPLRDGFIIR
ncbi:MAG: proline racemase family protein [Rhodothermia bacterium]